ncbi:conserved hypothetical protein, partial [Ricinus communis]
MALGVGHDAQQAAHVGVHAGQRRAQLVRHGGQAGAHAGQLLLRQHMAADLGHRQHRDGEPVYRHLLQHLPAEQHVAGAQRRRRGAGQAGADQVGAQRQAGVEMEQHHQPDQQRLAPHAGRVVHQEHEGEEKRKDVAERDQQVQVEHLAAELAREQAERAQQDAEQAQRQRFILLREEVLPDHVVQRHAHGADAGQQQHAHGRMVLAAVVQQQGLHQSVLPALPA